MASCRHATHFSYEEANVFSKKKKSVFWDIKLSSQKNILGWENLIRVAKEEEEEDELT
jgi:hypothetical protein